MARPKRVEAVTTSDRELSALVAEKIMGVEAQKVRAAGHEIEDDKEGA